MRDVATPLPRSAILNAIHRVVAVAASLRLAVGLLALDAGLLAWATLVESRDGTAAAHFAVYDSAWFLALNAVLAVNVLCAVLIRFPWKRRHVGFILTHTGILVLLAGCLMSRQSGVAAHLPVFEGRAVHEAYTDSWHFELSAVPPDSPEASGQSAGGTAAEATTADGEAAQDQDRPTATAAPSRDNKPEKAVATAADCIRIPFVPGPFNWSEYKERAWFPWHVAYRSRGRIYDRDGIVLEVVDYQKAAEEGDEPQPEVKVKLTVDGQTDEFDLRGTSGDGRDGRRHIVESQSRKVAIALRPDTIDLGFQVYLHRFQRKLDPGADTASHYSSLVTFLDRGDPPRCIKDNVLITLNAPVDVADPKTGRSWRLFQASFKGPWKPGDRGFDELADREHQRDQIYLSYLSVNADPGRGLKYFGSLMIVVGMIAVFRRVRVNARSLP
jgi:hypothetical protein